MKMPVIGFICILILVLQVCSQSDSIEYPECTFKKLSGSENVIPPDSFYFGRNDPSPSAHFVYVYFGIPELSLVKFNIYDSEKNLLNKTTFCLIDKGNYYMNWYEDVLFGADISSGVYFLEMKALSPKTKELSFQYSKKVIFVK
jgi:hypothetical protein